MRFALLTVSLLAAAGSPAFAQESGTRTPVEHNQTLATSPITDILGFINAEYQHKVADSVTIGASAGIFDIDDDNYSNVMAFARYYPQNAPLTGFYFGGRAGVHRIRHDSSFGPDRRTTSTPAVGVDVGYDWLLGRKRNIYIGLGAGAMRLLGGDDDGYDLLTSYPTARLNIGFAF